MKNEKQKMGKAEPRPSMQSGSAKETKPPFPMPSGEMPSSSPSQPGGPESPKASGTISQAGDGSLAIDKKIAGEILNLPFEFVNIFEPAWEPLNEKQLEKMSEPFSLWLEEHGLEKLQRSEIVLGFWLLTYGVQQSKNVKKARAERKAKKANASDNSRSEGDRKDVPGVVDGSKVEGSKGPDPGL